jgi:hypothetical protein
MRRITISSSVLLLLVIALAASLGAVGGVFTTLALQPGPVKEIPLYASATDTGTSVAMATGLIDADMEGVFLLDFKTGQLAAVVINSQNPKMIGGLLKANVAADLGVEAEKRPAYLMVTGLANFNVPKVGAEQMGKCVVYVLDQNSGNFVGYGFMWNPLAAKAAKPQEGTLVPLVKSKLGGAAG